MTGNHPAHRKDPAFRQHQTSGRIWRGLDQWQHKDQLLSRATLYVLNLISFSHSHWVLTVSSCDEKRLKGLNLLWPKHIKKKNKTKQISSSAQMHSRIPISLYWLWSYVSFKGQDSSHTSFVFLQRFPSPVSVTLRKPKNKACVLESRFFCNNLRQIFGLLECSRFHLTTRRVICCSKTLPRFITSDTHSHSSKWPEWPSGDIETASWWWIML